MPMHREENIIRAVEAIEAPEAKPVVSSLELLTSENILNPEEKDRLSFIIKPEFVERLSQFPTSMLLRSLESMIADINVDLRGRYLEQRNAYVAIQLELNKRFAAGEDGVASPAFRPRLKRKHQPKDIEKLLSNDTQVIDMDFLHCVGRRTVSQGHAAKAFAGEIFDLDEAIRFVRTTGNTRLKLEILGIHDSPFMQFQLAAYREDKWRDKQSSVKKSITSTVGKLEIASQSNPRVKGREKEWAAVVTAQKVCESFGMAATPKNLSAALQAMSGVTSIRRDKIKERIASAQRYL